MCVKLLLILSLLISTNAQQTIYFFENGGYKMRICLPCNDAVVSAVGQNGQKFQCQSSNISCGYLSLYECDIPCGFRFDDFTICENLFRFSQKKLNLQLIQPDYEYFTNKLSISNERGVNLETIKATEIQINFTETSINCFNISANGSFINCSLQYHCVNQHRLIKTNVSISVGNLGCSYSANIGSIVIKPPLCYGISITVAIVSFFILVLIIVIIVSIISISVCLIKRKYKKSLLKAIKSHTTELTEQQTQQNEVHNKKAFLDDQTAANSSSNLGTSTPYQLLPSDDDLSKTLNLELITATNSGTDENLANFVLLPSCSAPYEAKTKFDEENVQVMKDNSTILPSSVSNIEPTGCSGTDCSSPLLQGSMVKCSLTLIDEKMRLAACEEDEEYFAYLLQRHSVDWTVMTDGETILTALLKEANVKFSRLLLNNGNASQLVDLLNRNGDSPLLMAIKADVDELMDELILKTKMADIENSDGMSAMSLLFKKLSVVQGERRARISLWIKQLILKSANIYKVNRHGHTAISCCRDDVLRAEFELFSSLLIREEFREMTGAAAAGQKEEPTLSNVCTVCLDRPINCCLRCGHTFCMECLEELYECPYCRATDMTATRIFFN